MSLTFVYLGTGAHSLSMHVRIGQRRTKKTNLNISVALNIEGTVPSSGRKHYRRNTKHIVPTDHRRMQGKDKGRQGKQRYCHFLTLTYQFIGEDTVLNEEIKICYRLLQTMLSWSISNRRNRLILFISVPCFTYLPFIHPFIHSKEKSLRIKILNSKTKGELWIILACCHIHKESII